MTVQPERTKAARDWTIPIVVCAGALVIFGGIAFFTVGPRLRDQALISGAQKAAAAELRDPSSAQFRNVRIVGMHVCGEINGKNGFGAYNGFVRFHGTKDSAEVDPGDGGQTFYGEPVMKSAFESSYKIWCAS